MENVRHFAFAILAGALAGGGLFLLLTVPIGVGIAFDGDLLTGLIVALLPLGISAGGTLAGTVFVGLPLTGLLRRYDRERQNLFTAAGAISGFFLPAVFLAAVEEPSDMFLPAGVFFGLFGSMAGTAAGTVWGTWREGRRVTSPNESPDQPANPIHDLIH